MSKNNNQNVQPTKQEQPSDETQAELRKYTEEELKKILEDHKKWLESDGKEGKKADLSYTDLEGFDMSELDLRYAKFIGAVLKRADLHGANLQETNLSHSNLEGAKLNNANIKKANFYGASLRDSDIESVKLLGHEFAGADLTGAKPFEEKYGLKVLAAVEQISVNARRIFAVLLSTCAYTLLTFLTTSDLDLLLNRGSFTLPVVGGKIDILKFTLIVPFVLIGLFIYLHYYLNRLWTALALLPAKFPDGLTIYDRAYPWVMTAIARRYNALLKQDRLFMEHLEEICIVALSWGTVPATIVFLWMRCLPLRDKNITYLQVVIISISFLLSLNFYRRAANTIMKRQQKKVSIGRFYKSSILKKLVFFCLCSLFFGFISLGIFKGTPGRYLKMYGDISAVIPWVFESIGLRAFYDLREANISQRSADYWNSDSEKAQLDSVIGAPLKRSDLRFADMYMAFLVKANLRNADLRGSRLREADVRNANLRGANLQSADLRGGKFQSADFREANLTETNLGDTDLSNSQLGLANFRKADFNNANLAGADFRCADLQDVVNLHIKQLESVKTLYRANMDEAVRGILQKSNETLFTKPKNSWSDMTTPFNVGRKDICE
jgi:uncharacterized protein YjbI with pentapeptide repeats